MTEHLSRYLHWQRARRVAMYYATPEEADTESLITLSAEAGKDVYLPVINTCRWRQGSLLFQRFDPDITPLRKNRFGIPEPVYRPGMLPVQGTELDLVCVPLVGFTDNCDRIGMGAGYYDRAFSRRTWRRTHLLGVAFDCQRASFEPAAHDVPLHAVLTESGIITRKG